MKRTARILLCAAFLSVAIWTATSATSPGFGLNTTPVGVRELDGAVATRALGVRLTADWSEIERERGVYEWARLKTAVAASRAGGHHTVVCVTGSNPLYLGDGELPSPLRGESFDAWLDFVRSGVRTLAGDVDVIQIWDRVGDRGRDPDEYAYLLKSTAVVVRAESGASDTEVAIAQATLSVDGLEWQRRLWSRDSAAYIDVLPAAVSAEGDRAESAVAALLRENVQHPPAASVWAFVEEHGAPWETVAVAITALASGADFAWLDALPGRAGWLRGAQDLLDRGFAPAPLGRLRLEDESGVSLAGARVAGRFFSATDFSTLIFYLAPGGSPEEGLPRDRLVVDSRFVRNARTVDPSSGLERRSSAVALGEGRATGVRIPRGEHPLAVLFEKAADPSGIQVPTEQLAREATREPTVEEIVAEFQEVQRAQDDRLDRWIALGRIDFHFKFAQAGSSFDLSIDTRYFWERGGPLEWEETKYYINGNRIGWKSMPEFPLIQPEKVITLPLDLTLDRTYEYRLVGRERVAQREAYVLDFEPAEGDTGRNLYRGRLWIDTESFVRLKMSLVQPLLEDTPAVRSNEEVDRFAPQPGPDGTTYWMLTSVDGQQVWSTAGRNLVVRREVEFHDFEINPDVEEFERRREEAYASKNKMLRDTDRGFRYLDRQDDGTRALRQKPNTDQWMVGLGAVRDSSTGGVQPFAGANYFNYDLAGKKIQLNAFFAGLFGTASLSKPDLFGKRLDGTVDLSLLWLKLTDKVFLGESELEALRIKRRSQRLALRLGVPLGEFFKINLIGRLSYQEYFEDDDGTKALQSIDPELVFRLPEDHTELTGRFEAEFNRRGYNAIFGASASHRSDWSEWGVFDRSTGEFVVDQPVEQTYGRWALTGFKEWYLPKFQKARAELTYLDGENLDRYSQYQFSLFGDDRLFGFSGSGVRFDRGILARTGYSFNLFEVIRLDAALETAMVEPPESGRQSFTGVGLSGSIVGPWKTVINLNFGYALASDIPDIKGEHEFLVLIFKLF